MKQRSPSQKRKPEFPGRIARRARQISEAAGRPQEPGVHDWLKAESEQVQEPQPTAHRQDKIDPKDPV